MSDQRDQRKPNVTDRVVDHPLEIVGALIPVLTVLEVTKANRMVVVLVRIVDDRVVVRGQRVEAERNTRNHRGVTTAIRSHVVDAAIPVTPEGPGINDVSEIFHHVLLFFGYCEELANLLHFCLRKSRHATNFGCVEPLFKFRFVDQNLV